MYCIKCGNELKKEEKYCTNCGTPCEQEEIIENNPQTTKTNTNDTTISIVLGILSCLFFFIPFISIPLAIVSIITGINNQKEEKKFPLVILLGITSIILSILAIALIIFLVAFTADHIEDFDDDYQKDNIIDNHNDYYNRQKASIDIKGYSWLADDNSMLYLNSNYTYEWYEKDVDHEDNYHKGKYTTYQGKEAVKYIAENLKEFGLTEEKQNDFFNEGDYDLNNYYLIVLTCEKLKLKGEEKDGNNNVAYYYGLYDEETKKFNGANMATGTKVSFIRKEQLSNIDV